MEEWRDRQQRFYRSMAWRRVQRMCMERIIETPYGICAPLMCERCHERGVVRPADLVHHKTHVSPSNVDDPSVTLNPDNLMRVCRECHDALHGRGEPPRATFDAHGNVVGER